MFGEDTSEVRTILRSIEPGDVILKNKVSGFGESSRIATQVREGMRAVTIPINAVTGTAGHISPGDRVDIQYIRKTSQQVSSHILLQDVLVVATDQSTDSERTRAVVARTVTVEVNQTDAQKLTLAMETGTLSLFLRSVTEIGASSDDARSVDLSELPGAPVVAPEPPKPEPVVEENQVG